MFAVIKTGGKQYKVSENDIIDVEKLAANEGDKVTFSEVVALENDGKTSIGTPLVENASVEAEVLKQFKEDKIIVFKKKRRHNYRRKQGHRQLATKVKITSIKG